MRLYKRKRPFTSALPISLFAICFACQSVVTDSQETSAINSQISAFRAGDLSPYVVDSDSVEIEPYNETSVDEVTPRPQVNVLSTPDGITTAAPLASSSTTSTTKKPKKSPKRKPSTRKTQSAPQSSSASAGNRRKKPHQQNLSGSQSLVESVPDPSELKPEQTCLIGDVCMRNGRLGYCYKPHAPVKYEKDDLETEDFYEMMQESCSHFFDENENLHHPLCCSPEQEETIARLNANIDLIRRSCPSCLINVKKLFCNLFCAPNQRDFVRVDRVKGETVMEVTYAISDTFVQTFFSSCQDVRVFGAYLLDYEYGCGKLKRANCTAPEFMKVLGSLSEIPFNFRPLIVETASGKVLHPSSELDKEETILSKEWPRAVMNDTAHQCHQAPPNMSPCQCDHCPRMCSKQVHGPTSKLTKAISVPPKSQHPLQTTTSANSSSLLTSSAVAILMVSLFSQLAKQF